MDRSGLSPHSSSRGPMFLSLWYRGDVTCPGAHGRADIQAQLASPSHIPSASAAWEALSDCEALSRLSPPSASILFCKIRASGWMIIPFKGQTFIISLMIETEMCSEPKFRKSLFGGHFPSFATNAGAKFRLNTRQMG